MAQILVVSEVFPPQTGGSGRWLWELYRRFPAGSVAFAAGEHPRGGEFDRSHDLPVERLPLSFSTWGVASRRGLAEYMRAFRRLDWIVKRERPERLHCGKCLPEGLLAWTIGRWRGVPYVVYVHGEELPLAGKSRELSWLTRRVLRGAETIVANSHNTRRLLVDDWEQDAARVRVMHPGVDASKFVPAPRCAETRARFGWNDRPVLLTVGRLQRRKGQDQLLRALVRIREAFPEILYAIVGEGEEREALECLVGELELAEHVQFIGEVDDAGMIERYQQCDVFVLPNHEVDGDIEGFGMVLVEAQACGKPVIAGDSGGTVDTLLDGETGRIADCSDAGRLAEVVCEVLGDRAELSRMASAARPWVLENFDWPALVQQAERLFQLETVPVAPRAANSAIPVGCD